MKGLCDCLRVFGADRVSIEVERCQRAADTKGLANRLPALVANLVVVDLSREV